MTTKTIGTTMLCTAALLALTGCGQTAPGDPVTVTATATVTETAEAQSESPSPTATSPTASPSPSETAAGSEESGGRDYGENETSARGNLAKEPGQWAGIGSPDDPLVDFRIKSLEVDPGCTEAGAEEPENGHFLVLDAEVQTHEGVNEEFMGGFSLYQMEFKTIGEDGKTSNVDPATFAAFQCLPDEDELPQNLCDNEQAEGKIVLDVEDPSGVLVYENMMVSNGAGWEWEY